MNRVRDFVRWLVRAGGDRRWIAESQTYLGAVNFVRSSIAPGRRIRGITYMKLPQEPGISEQQPSKRAHVANPSDNHIWAFKLIITLYVV